MEEDNLDFDQPVELSERELKHLIHGYLTVFREMGMQTLRSGNVEAALRKFHAAAAAYPADTRNIIGRGQSRYRIKLLNKALADAEMVLQANEYNMDGILLQARCEYELGNAEEALLMFRRGANKRGERREFEEGGRAVMDTLENCVGRHSGDVLGRFRLTINAMIEKQRKATRREDQKGKSQCWEDNKPIYSCSDEEWSRLQIRWKKRDDQIAFVYLGNLANELRFSENLREDSDPRVRRTAQLACREIEDLLEILRARRPLYHFRHKYRSSEKIMAKEKKALLANKLKRMKESADRMLSNIVQLATKGLISECINQAHHMKLLLEKCSELAPKTKLGYINHLAELMGQTYFSMKRCDEKSSQEENYKLVAVIVGRNETFNKINFDMYSDVSSFPFFDAGKWIETYKGFIATTENDLERAWLYHELSRAYIVQQHWSQAHTAARKSQNYAKLCNHYVWEANALFLLLVGETRRKDGEVMRVLEECFDVGLKIGNEYYLELMRVARKILTVKVEEKAYNSLAANTERENMIVALIDSAEDRAKMRDLFSRMRALRDDRRMGLIPSGLLHTRKRGGALSIIRGGAGGRLGLRTKNQTYYQFLGMPDPFE